MAMVRERLPSGALSRDIGSERLDAYIYAKVFPPRLPTYMVSRPRVLARLAESLSKRLTLIEAPAGFGKTTLLCEWRQELLDQHAAAVAWLTLGHEDEHPKQVLSDIAEAMRRASRGRLDRTRALLATDPSTTVL